MTSEELAKYIKHHIDEYASADSDCWAISRIAKLRTQGIKASALIAYQDNRFELFVRVEHPDGKRSVESAPQRKLVG